MTDETALVKLQIQSTGRADILLEENDFLIVKWTLPNDAVALGSRCYPRTTNEHRFLL